MFLPGASLGVGSSILLRSLGKVCLLHRSYHALDKGNFLVVQTVFLVQHLVRPRVRVDLHGYVRCRQPVPEALILNNPTLVRVRDQESDPFQSAVWG